MPVVIYQLWEESEAGWGARPDGFTVHKNAEDQKAFIKEYWDKQPAGPTPAEYTRPDGNGFPMELVETDELYIKLIQSKNGVWGQGNSPPKSK